MKKETIKIQKLTASEGMTLTNGKTFGETVFLAKNDSADNWREITIAEAEELQNVEEVEEMEV